jgi:alkylation response protein AidB-like acyl-CoA dehydrogenase
MLEYDIQLYFRRIKAWALQLGDSADEWARLADRLAAAGWRLGDGPVEGFRAELREFLTEHCTPEVLDRADETGTIHDWGLHRALAERGLLAAGWSREWGGQARDPFEMMVMGEELARAQAPTDGWLVAEMVIQTLSISGTEAQKRDIIPRVLNGEILIAIGYSEPDSGSDVAAAKTRAIRDGDDWIINGQKMFTTLAHESSYVFLLARTNLDVPKHRGLTMFFVPMDTPGIEVTPVHTLGGERTNITYYTDVRVPDSWRIGEVDGGWQVMQVALAFERQPAALGDMTRLYRHGVAWARDTARDGRPRIDEPSVRERLARVALDCEVAWSLGYRLTARAAAGELPIVEGSMAKLYASEAFVRASSSLLDMTGAEGLLRHGEPDAAADGWIQHAFRHAQVMTIYAGTSEIQRSIIAERGLGLPRAR